MDSFLDLISDYKVVINIFAIIVVAFAISRVLQWMLNKGIARMSGNLNIDPTRYRFFKNALNVIIFVTATMLIIYSIPQLKNIAVGLFAGAGILLAAVGFAAQEAFSNVISGLLIVLSKPYRVGDLISVGNKEQGVVEDITLRHTVIRDFRNRSIIIPNSIMSAETIVNDSINDIRVCRWIEVGISYDSDVDLAMKIMREVSEAHPNCIDARSPEDKKNKVPKVKVRLMTFGDSSLNLRALVWTDKPIEAFQMQSDLNIAIKKRFDKEGVEIPFPYRTVVFKKDLPKNT